MAAHHHVLVLLCEGEGGEGGRREERGRREGGEGEERGRRGREKRGRNGGGEKGEEGRGREVVVYEDTVHITALIIHLSLTITPDTHTVVLVSELDPLFKEGDAVTSFPTIYKTWL